MDEKKPYKAGTRHEVGLYCVDGPGCGMGYYGHTLWPHLSMGWDEAIRAAEIANIAFKEGYAAAQYSIRKALGIKGVADV